MFVNKLDFEIEVTNSFTIGAKPFEKNQDGGVCLFRPCAEGRIR